MAANYRQLVRSTLVGVLSASFNSTLSALAVSSIYQIPPFVIDFDYGSKNFVQGFIDPLSFEYSVAAIEPPGLVVYTSEAVDEHRMKNAKFSGGVLGHMDFYLQYRSLLDFQTTGNDITELEAQYAPDTMADCVEDAALSVLTSSAGTFAAANCMLVNYRADRDPIVPLGDGLMQRVALTLGFTVHVR